ncbi:hypothetical protein TNCV_685731 [Trichonephila clavipes]|nr:hypothetical protein TNCV_685731 [Trichonephila clavipes]
MDARSISEERPTVVGNHRAHHLPDFGYQGRNSNRSYKREDLRTITEIKLTRNQILIVCKKGTDGSLFPVFSKTVLKLSSEAFRNSHHSLELCTMRSYSGRA